MTNQNCEHDKSDFYNGNILSSKRYAHKLSLINKILEDENNRLTRSTLESLHLSVLEAIYHKKKWCDSK